jgi:hypothetical protein
MGTKESMRHIPEEELHAYLDQGLSRSQCVEIESHLASCPSCQAERDAIAALRDRTTALLARLAPRRGFPPAFESLRRRAAVEASDRRRRLHRAAWAASVVAALGLGWTGNYLMTPRPAPTIPIASSPTAAARTATSSIPFSPASVRPVRTSGRAAAARPAGGRQAARQVLDISPAESLPPVVPAPALELTSVDIPRREFELELDGMWRTLSWDGAQAETGDELPHVGGLPVVQVQVQAGEAGKGPLMVVAQQLASGEVIRTIEGPMSDVSHLLARRTMTDPAPTTDTAKADTSRTKRGENSTDRTMAMQRGDRMLVITGDLPQDSLLAMIRRMNAEMRSK